MDTYHHLIPTNPARNLAKRIEIMGLASDSERAKTDFWIMCSRDLLFFTRGFVWTFAPILSEEHPDIPFIPYPKQEECMLAANECIGKRDLLMEKSRDQGASWIFLIVIAWRWLFRKGQAFLLVSRNQDYVDKAGNPKALFQKLDFLFQRLPYWMMPPHVRIQFHYENINMGSVIDGESTTGSVARGDRRNCIVLDEFADFDVADGYKALSSTQKATRSRLFNSTPQGASGAYYDMAHLKGMKKIRLHWSDHPVQRLGMYDTDNEGRLRLIDKKFWIERLKKLRDIDATEENILDYAEQLDYDFQTDGKLRSPYYDEECLKTPVKSIIGQELDIEYLGSGSQFFDDVEINAIERLCLSPFMTGGLKCNDIDFYPERFEPEPRGAGKIKLWCKFDESNRILPYKRQYVIGVDISGGVGSSNSVAAVYDAQTRELVLEFVSNNDRPERFAEIVFGLGKWFRGDGHEDPCVIFEAQGPGRSFGARIAELDYDNLYMRRSEDSIAKARHRVDIPGMMMTRDIKRAVYAEYGRALAAREIHNRSKDSIQEMRFFVHMGDGSIAHSGSRSTLDPAGARLNHGDRVTASALAWHVLKDLRRAEREAEEDDSAPVGSMAWRMEQHEKKERENEEWFVYSYE